MAVLLLDATSSKAISKVVAHATANPLKLEDMEKYVAGLMTPIGDNPNHTCEVAVGYRCSFSIEPTRDSRMVRHLSVSIGKPDRYPSVQAVEALMIAFGFEHDLEHDDVHSFPEQGDITVLAINIVELIDGSTHMAM